MHLMGELLAVQKTDQASARLGVALQAISGIFPRRATTPGLVLTRFLGKLFLGQDTRTYLLAQVSALYSYFI